MNQLPPPLHAPIAVTQKEGEWVSVDMGSGVSKCFNKNKLPTLPFGKWNDQVITNPKYDSQQSCIQANLCTDNYEERIQTLETPRPYYTLGPKTSIHPRKPLSMQPYEFPLPLDYPFKNPEINLAFYPWYGPP